MCLSPPIALPLNEQRADHANVPDYSRHARISFQKEKSNEANSSRGSAPADVVPISCHSRAPQSGEPEMTAEIDAT